MLPGYRDIIEQLTHIQVVGRCPALAEMPACSLGRAATKDGLPVYVLLCSQLYDRPGNPYGDESGRDWPDNDIRFARFASAAASTRSMPFWCTSRATMPNIGPRDTASPNCLRR